jgi:peptidoglycan hydrolase CwlO-like protein
LHQEKRHQLSKMKEFLIKYFKEILIIILLVTILFLFLRPRNEDPTLLNYKLEELDKTINNLKERQNLLDSTIKEYKDQILKVDNKITNKSCKCHNHQCKSFRSVKS